MTSYEFGCNCKCSFNNHYFGGYYMEEYINDCGDMRKNAKNIFKARMLKAFKCFTGFKK